jgi:hypothetical protein
MTVSRLLLPAGILLATSPALATGGVPQRALLYVVSTAAASNAWRPEDASVAVAQLAAQPTSLSLLPNAAANSAAPPALDLQMPSGGAAAGSKASGYKSLLGSLVIARDLSIPGAESMGLRLIPTTDPLAGDSATIVFRPRLIGSSWVGVDVAARF